MVAIGGGTGLATLLRGLKRYVPAREDLVPVFSPRIEITGSGHGHRRRRQFRPAAARIRRSPPGRYPQLHGGPGQDEALLSQLFNYRFTSGRGLKGHSFGNLFLTAMTGLTGDFAQAVKLSSEVLAVNGRIYPSTIRQRQAGGDSGGGTDGNRARRASAAA